MNQQRKREGNPGMTITDMVEAHAQADMLPVIMELSTRITDGDSVKFELIRAALLDAYAAGVLRGMETVVELEKTSRERRGQQPCTNTENVR